MMELKLFPRADGRYGVRNRIAVISTVACANHVAASIAAAVEGADPYTHPYGCDQLGDDLRLSAECLLKMATHPNNGAALIVGLGCEEIIAEDLCGQAREQGQRAAWLNIQDNQGTTASVAAGIAICEDFARQLQEDRRQPAPLSALIVGLECGGSDFTSGVAANPAMGLVAQRLCQANAKAVFGETTELIGTEDILEKLCQPEHFDFIRRSIRRIEDYAAELKVDLRGSQPSPGNIAGGLSTIEEKALGAVCKTGSNPIVDALEFGQTIATPGLSFMDTPGNDLACTLGMCCGGAQIVIFSTGRGTPMGFAAAPVIKITANSRAAQVMRENIDVDLSPIINGADTLEQGAERLFEHLLAVANGRETSAEKLGHREFSLYRTSALLT